MTRQNGVTKHFRRLTSLAKNPFDFVLSEVSLAGICAWRFTWPKRILFGQTYRSYYAAVEAWASVWR
jgi:hypothetical protein